MSREHARVTIAAMRDPDQEQLCGHGYAPGACPVCGAPGPSVGESWHALFDPELWVAAYTASSPEQPEVHVDLIGVPLS
jgi:hypothetical protein